MKKYLQSKVLILVGLLLAGGTTAWADTKTDVLNQEWTEISGTTYTAFTGKTATSDAVYAGNCAGGNNSIQLRSNNNNSGIVTTASGGTVKSITVTWNDNTSAGRTLNVYGKNSAYSAASDLYDSDKQGTLLGTIVMGTSTSLTIEDDYAFIGFRSASSAMYLDKVEIVWETSGATLETPTFAFSAAAFTAVMGKENLFPTLDSNTDGAVTYSSSNEDVATIDATTGVITLLAAGETTIKAAAEATDTYYAAETSYILSVDDGKQKTEVSIDLGSAFFGDINTSGSSYDEVSGSKDNVDVTYTRNSGSLYVNTNIIRFYKSNELTFDAPNGYNIKNIVLTVASTKTDLSANVGTIAEFTTTSTEITWTGNTGSVTFTRPSTASGYMNISKAVITLAAASSVPAPTFSVESGDYDLPFTLTITADGSEEIWYTLDGTDPTAEGVTPLTGTSPVNIIISETTTVTAVAIDSNADASDPVSATYTLPVAANTFAEMAALANDTRFNATIDVAQVLYVSGNEMWVKDETGTMEFYTSGIEAAAGDYISGSFSAVKSHNRNNPQIKTFANVDIEVVDGDTPVADVIDAADIADNLNNLVTLKGVTVANNKIGSVQVYDKFKLGYELEDGTYDITGIVIVYNSTYEICPTVAPSKISTVTITDAEWATYVATDNVYFEDVTAYIVSETSTTSVTLQEVLAVEAGTPVLVNGAADTYTLEVVDAADCDDVTDNKLLVSDGTDAVGDDIYVLGNKNGVGFYRWTSASSLSAGKVYLKITSDEARLAIAIGGGSNGIDAITEAAEGRGVYSLQGMRVAQPTKGLYIVNGKKMVVK